MPAPAKSRRNRTSSVPNSRPESPFPVVTSPRLAVLGHVRHAFFTRQGGVSEGLYASLNGGQGSDDEPAHVRENRARMVAALGVPGPLVSVYQVHSPDVAVVAEPWEREAAPKADAMVTDRPGIALGITTADCGPVLFADPNAQVIGAAHAGWRGAVDGVIAATVEAMERLGARRSRILAAIGPLIRQPSYEVGPDFIARVREAHPLSERYFAAGTGDRAYFDLPGFIRDRLAEAGVGEIEDLGLDTYADEARFFSYRRTTHRGEPDYGRLISAIALSS
ncbi:peptidoglycan editing factor PgeF [Blastochloris sulfoviridis]|uniref:Purine nucleoside phosphorylase n=1 Tax=Blastochloris sulfoviridis TaxID=50712 RepID=A0A5M6I4E2_9HYPH|nr:peptidoglycan editing factor PgeF [Blastochloris sulfoviridis]